MLDGRVQRKTRSPIITEALEDGRGSCGEPKLPGMSLSLRHSLNFPASSDRERTMASRMRPLSTSIMSNARRKTASTRLAAINRQFSTSPQAMAFEVKKLGVVGAGQMV